MNEVHRSLFFSAIERYSSVFFFVITAAVLSRLLTPQEFGIFAMINATVTMTVALYQEFGGANYLIQKRSLSEHDIRTAFTIMLCLSALCAIVLFELRSVAADFFSEDRLKIGIAIATLNFILTPFSITISALFRRDLSFGILARCNIAANFVTSVTSIVLAVLRYSYLAPIWGMLIGQVVQLALLLASRRDLKIFKPSFSGFGAVFSFGAYSSGTVIINVFYNLAPQFILGRVLDFNAVGLYSRAVNITQVFDKIVIQVYGPVILPAMAAQTRAGNDLKKLYVNAIELITVLQWPFLIFIAMMSEPIIAVWLGPKWSEIVPLIRFMSIASLSLFAASLTFPFLVVAGHVRDTLVSSLISLPPSLCVIFIAAFFGVQAVAASTLLIFPFEALVAFLFVGRRLSMKPIDFGRATLKSAFVTGCSTISILASMVVMHLSMAPPIFELILAAVFAGVGWSLGLLITRHPFLDQMHLAINGLLAGALRLRRREKKTRPINKLL